jgi:hypothetical protein
LIREKADEISLAENELFSGRENKKDILNGKDYFL